MDVKKPIQDLILLHGFLGQGSDWSFLESSIDSELFRIHSLDYTNDPLLNPRVTNLQTWGSAFSKWLRSQSIEPENSLLIGYSQGGRLALHALEFLESLRGAILISTNPGLSDDDLSGREQRQMNDQKWSHRFQSEPWSVVLNDWNRQPVFMGTSKDPERVGSAKESNIAIASLNSWSLAKQKDFRPYLSNHPEKVFWMFGDRDEKFIELWVRLKRNIPNLDGEIIKNSGHRILFDQPGALLESLKKAILRF